MSLKSRHLRRKIHQSRPTSRRHLHVYHLARMALGGTRRPRQRREWWLVMGDSMTMLTMANRMPHRRLIHVGRAMALQ